MPFKEDHPNYKQYRIPTGLHFSDVPHKAWSEFESLIDVAAGEDRELLVRVLSSLAKIARFGHVEPGLAVQYIPDVVSSIKKRVEAGQFNVFMDCLAVLCDEGKLTIDDLSEYLEENEFGYRALTTFGGKISWSKIDETKDDIDKIPDESSLQILKNSNNQLQPREIQKEKYKNNMRNMIFISHRAVDAEVSDMIKDFLVSTGIPNDKIFCSSLPGNDVNERIEPEVKDKLRRAVIIIVILSKDYYESAYCLNEAGVAWYLDEVKTIPFGLPEIKHSNMIGFLNSDYILRTLDNDDDIASFFDQVQDCLKIDGIKHSVVNRESKKLKNRYLKYLEEKKSTNVDKAYDYSSKDDDYGSKSENKRLLICSKIEQIINEAGGEIRGTKEVQEKLGINAQAASKSLMMAIENGNIENVGSGKNRIYRVKKAT